MQGCVSVVTGGTTRYVRSALPWAYPCTSEAYRGTQGETGHPYAEGPPGLQWKVSPNITLSAGNQCTIQSNFTYIINYGQQEGNKKQMKMKYFILKRKKPHKNNGLGFSDKTGGVMVKNCTDRTT